VKPIEVVETFVERLNQNRIDEAAELLAEDIFYHNIPMEPITGREAWRAFNDEFGIGTQVFCNWQMLTIAQSDDVVLTERLDEFYNAEGRRITIPVMGSFRVRDGVIGQWSDYFDMGDLMSQFGKLNNPTDHPDIEHYVGQQLQGRGEAGRT
jgi:limonene-1,2-epoxide hydrolase